MCGIFGYAGDAPPDPEKLVLAALAAGRRGPHGHGWASHNEHGGLEAHRRLGHIADSRDRLADVTARRLVGHARLATSGDWRDPAGLQPAIVDRHAIAHNGHVHEGLDHQPGTDTAALADLYADHRAAGTPPDEALAKTIHRAQQRAWAVAVLDADGGLWAHRRYHPLYWWADDRGVYLSSRPAHPVAVLLTEDEPVRLGGA